MKVLQYRDSNLTDVEPGTILIPNVGLREIEGALMSSDRESALRGYIMWLFLGCGTDSGRAVFMCLQIVSDQSNYSGDWNRFPHGVVVKDDSSFFGVAVELVESR